MGGRRHGLSPEDAEQLERVVALVREVLETDALGAYLHGSAVLGGLRPHSDLDVLAVAVRSTTRAEKERLAAGLLAVSTYPGPPRPVELTIVAQPDVRPWRYPPRLDFQYGEWLRKDFERGLVEPGRVEQPDLVTLLTMVLRNGRPVFGPPPAELLDAPPPGEYARAVASGMDGLAGDFETDTRNAVLTSARIWCTLATGEIRSKDAAADWALARLPEELREPLVRARAIYLGEQDERWDDVDVRPYADAVVTEIRSLTDDGLEQPVNGGDAGSGRLLPVTAEAKLEPTEVGVTPTGDGWFVLNARDSMWVHAEGRSAICIFEGQTNFDQLGINIGVHQPGEAMAMYHWEADEEDFLVISGEGVLIIEGEERPLKQWDFVHCPPGTKHVIVGAGTEPLIVVAVGARDRSVDNPDWGGYAPDETAAKYGASVEKETNEPGEAYAGLTHRRPTRYREGWLPD